ncbi:hypothetical protein WJX73_000736 [Symbiochloris irregularis]|uniref:J domain-containing protein n=1 Tax=Symbiochloris irregularis TaxID=706552 RepID=A0AAW1NQ71_9CHLO
MGQHQIIAAKSTLCLLLILSVSLTSAGRDYYDILSVPRGADEATIKRAYRKLAVKFHPDKVEGSAEEKKNAEIRFAEINAAYEALSDSEKRKIYDRHGEEGLKQHASGGGRGGGNPAGDIFSQFFGGAFGGGFFGGGGGEEEEQTPKGNDVYVELEVSLRDLYLGNSFKVVRDKSVIRPAKGKRKCNCKNKMVTRQVGPGMYQQYTTQECEDCQNVQLVREAQELVVTVDAGAADGQEIMIFEEGEPMVDGEAGDLKFVITSPPHRLFQRTGDDLRYNATITLMEALIGFTKEIEHLDGHKVALHSDGVTIPGEQHVIQGEGMPLKDDAHQHGSLHVTYTVLFPKKLDQKQKGLVKKLFETVHDEL